MILRPYQTQAVADCLRLLRAGRRVVCAVPTGGGKTVIGAAVCAAFPTARIRWTAHRRELINQARAKVPPTVGVFAVQERRTVVADLLVIDEAHHSVAGSYRRHIDAHDGPILGLTATPYRLDGRGLGAVFSDIVAPVTTADLVASGVLVAPRCFSLGGSKPATYAKLAGDFKQDEIAAAMDKPVVEGCAVTEYRERTPGTRAVAFCVTVAHAQHVAAAFNAAGIPAAVLAGDMPTAERDAVLRRLTAGELKVVASCMVLTEGWDLPALETAIILRPTASLCLHLQMIGRVMRSCDGKAGATVLDHAGNVLRLGLVTAPVAFTLDGVDRAKVTSATGLKTCPECYAIVPAATNPCDCGYEWGAEVQGDLIVGGIGGSERLAEVVPATTREKDAAWRAFEDERVLRNFAPGWSVMRFKEAFNEYPIFDENRKLVDKTSPMAPVIEFRRLISIGKGPRQAWAITKRSLGKAPPWAMVIDAERKQAHG